MDTTSSKRLYTAVEVAAIFGCGRRTVMTWAASGLIPRVRVGGITRYRAEDIERLISQNDEGPAENGTSVTAYAAGTRDVPSG